MPSCVPNFQEFDAPEVLKTDLRRASFSQHDSRSVPNVKSDSKGKVAGKRKNLNFCIKTRFPCASPNFFALCEHSSSLPHGRHFQGCPFAFCLVYSVDILEESVIMPMDVGPAQPRSAHGHIEK